jgi:hypothetical protein
MIPRPDHKNPNGQILVAIGFSITFAIVSSLIASPSYAATPCVVPEDCGSGFCVDKFCCNTACNNACDACSAAKKGGGADGECGLAAEDTTCKASYCNGDLFSYIGPSKCNAGGSCIEPSPVDCSGNDPCLINLCGDTGCEVGVKLDGTECGVGMTCQNGNCMMGGSSSSSSGGGAGGTGGIGGAGGMSSSSSGTGGTGGMGEVGGATGSSSSGQVDPYPPSGGKGCTCRVSENESFSGTTSGVVATLLLASHYMRRRRRAE